MDKDRVVGSAKDFAGKAESAIGDAAGDTDTQTSGRIREAAGKVQDLYGQAKDVARDATDTATGYAQSAIDGSEGAETIAKMVRDSPIQSLFVAGGIGFMLAMLLRQPSPRRQQRRSRYYD
jgi:uncharacterized protein YjbJ (UPF0337 family)